MGRDSSGATFHWYDGLQKDRRWGSPCALAPRLSRAHRRRRRRRYRWEYLFSRMSLEGEISNYIILLVKVGRGRCTLLARFHGLSL